MELQEMLNKIDINATLASTDDFKLVEGQILLINKINLLELSRRKECIFHHLNEAINLLESLEVVLGMHSAQKSIFRYMKQGNILERVDATLAPIILAMQAWDIECADDFEHSYLDLYQVAEDLHLTANDYFENRIKFPSMNYDVDKYLYDESITLVRCLKDFIGGFVSEIESCKNI
jgi:hypothetical protein